VAARGKTFIRNWRVECRRAATAGISNALRTPNDRAAAQEFTRRQRRRRPGRAEFTRYPDISPCARPRLETLAERRTKILDPKIATS